MKYLFTLLFSIVLFNSKIFCQDKVFYKADSLFLVQNYSLAQVEYERIIFLYPDDFEQKAQAILKKIYTLKAQKKFSEILWNLERLDNLTPLKSDTLRFNLLYEGALSAFLNKNYILALSFIDFIKYQDHFEDNNLTQKVDYLEIISWNEKYLNDALKNPREFSWESVKQNWQKSKELMKIYLAKKNIKTNIDSLYSFLNKVKFKSYKKARTLSTIFPSLGQYYAGYFWRGTASLLLNTGSWAFSFLNFRDGYYFSGAITGLGLTQKLYLGGRRHSAYLAIKKNEEIVKRHNQNLQNFIFEIERQN